MADEADHQLAARVAAEAGKALTELRATRSSWDDGQLRDEADRLSNDLILDLLSHRIDSGDALLSEEKPDDPARLGAHRVWIVDPLDGTREFAEDARVDWAVHVGLSVNGEPRVGAVCLPALGEVWSTASQRPVPRRIKQPRIVVSRTRPPSVAAWVAERLGGRITAMGSAGAKAMAVLRGDADIYLHAGGQHEWDSCAPVAVALAAGLHASRLDGTALRYNQRDPYLPDLLICRPELTERVLAAVASYPDDGSGGGG